MTRRSSPRSSIFIVFRFFFTPLSFPTGIRFSAPPSLARSLARTLYKYASPNRGSKREFSPYRSSADALTGSVRSEGRTNVGDIVCRAWNYSGRRQVPQHGRRRAYYLSGVCPFCRRAFWNSASETPRRMRETPRNPSCPRMSLLAVSAITSPFRS